jgi:hypothetical protein
MKSLTRSLSDDIRIFQKYEVKMFYGNLPIVEDNNEYILREKPKPIINDIETSVKNIISSPFKPTKRDWEIINDWIKFGKPITRLVLSDTSLQINKIENKIKDLEPILPKRSSKIYIIEDKIYTKYPCVSSIVTELYDLLTEKSQ